MNQADHNAKTIVVVGGSAGLGLAIASEAARNWDRVWIVGRREEQLKTAVESLKSERIHIAVADASDRDSLTQLTKQLTSEGDLVHAVVHCVGTSDRGLAAEIDPQELSSAFEINAVSSLLVAQAFQDSLTESRGSLVFIGSLASKVAPRKLGTYAITKHALAALAQQLRMEWWDAGIHVGLVNPGPIKRLDAGQRYANRYAEGESNDVSAQPGGGTRVKGLEPQKVAREVLKCVERRSPDVIIPGYLRILIAVGHLSPRLGDWLLRRFMR